MGAPKARLADAGSEPSAPQDRSLPHASIELSQVRDFFDGLAEGWDQRLARGPEEMARIGRILELADVRPGCRVLDVACGTGILEGELLARGAVHVIAVDLSPRMIESARQKGFGERVDFVVGDASQLALPSCDRAIVFDALPHFASVEGLVSNLVRSLEPGGRLTIAHEASRDVINGGHRRGASSVSRGLGPAFDLAHELSPWVEVDTVLDREIYVVSGLTRRA